MTDTPKANTAATARKYGLRVALALLVFGVLGFFALPPIVKSMLSTKLADALQRRVAVDSVSINPFTLTVQLAGLAIREKDGGELLAGFDRLEIDAEWSSLWRRAPVIRELNLVAPTFRLLRLEDGGFNVSDLIDEFMATPASDDPAPHFSLNNIRISGGKLEFDDLTLADKHVISEIDISVPSISSLPQAVAIFVEPSFSASIDGSPLRAQGKASRSTIRWKAS